LGLDTYFFDIAMAVVVLNPEMVVAYVLGSRFDSSFDLAAP
jgi:hypothetical protein